MTKEIGEETHKGENKMHRVQLLVKVTDSRETALLGSWTCPNEEIANKKAESLKKTYKDSDYIIKIFSI